MSDIIDRSKLDGVTPEEARKLFRAGEYFKMNTSGICKGFLQTNVLSLDKALAVDFAKFCADNSGSLPVVFQSEVGQFTAPGITKGDSDIRTDLAAYAVIEDGVITRVVRSLQEYEDVLKDFVTFYQGCSFSFDEALLEAGVPLRNIEQNCNISIFKSGVNSIPVGPFSGKMCISLRPLPLDKIETAFLFTLPFTSCHSSPVHIGHPERIGITNIHKPDFGDPVDFTDGDIPVFWCCGVTVVEAIKSTKCPLAFTHSPGCMYISDTLLEVKLSPPLNPTDLPKIIPLVDDPYWASVTSQAVVDKMAQLERYIAEDLGNRNIGRLVVPGDLLKSALAISHASSVALTTGFPCFTANNNPYEDDGPPGAVAIAMMLQALGKKVDLLADKVLYGPLTTVLDELIEKKVLAEPINVLQYPPEGMPDTLETARTFLRNGGGSAPRYDHLLAIERAGRADDGGYYTMRAVDVGHLVGGLDWLFEAATDNQMILTTGIGDGGNELGMGKVKDIIHRDIPNGPTIACSTASDYLLTTGVSNWGGYAVAVALYLLNRCPIHDRYRRRAIGYPPSPEDVTRFRKALPDVDREEDLLRILISHEFYDMTGRDVLDVDGLSFKDVHSKKIQQLLSVVEDE